MTSQGITRRQKKQLNLKGAVRGARLKGAYNIDGIHQMGDAHHAHKCLVQNLALRTSHFALRTAFSRFTIGGGGGRT